RRDTSLMCSSGSPPPGPPTLAHLRWPRKSPGKSLGSDAGPPYRRVVPSLGCACRAPRGRSMPLPLRRQAHHLLAPVGIGPRSRQRVLVGGGDPAGEAAGVVLEPVDRLG